MEKIITQPFLIMGDVIHSRLFPKKNNFQYSATYISFPISKINTLNTSFFSINKFNIFSLHINDYGDAKTSNINEWITNILHTYNIDNIDNIVLITQPKVLGYAFNPVSFWLCFDSKNKLIAVVNEVNNTCGQKHTYLCFKENLQVITAHDWLETHKEFYVSPFMEVEGKYKFRFQLEDENITFFIHYLVNNKTKLITSLQCNLREFNDKNLIKNFLKMPGLMFKTIFLIHYQALKLYLKSIPYYKYPAPKKNNITTTNHEQ